MPVGGYVSRGTLVAKDGLGVSGQAGTDFLDVSPVAGAAIGADAQAGSPGGHICGSAPVNLARNGSARLFATECEDF
ncbi:hypothetical protein N0V83_007225 [Neocucurbitaria cava]|uniref:Uncharacterized protein n=1 Tax=Neocucurbitaria cava TaxID=798079 RepID=A0A9W8Y6I9_9PLEO|nr:hypothetical protein N0V83_007225 [Neocucurbitaria cava]